MTEEKGKKILLVDDEEGILYTLDRILKSKGYLVERASSGLKALEKLEKEKFDLVISDYSMPRMTGSQLYSALLERGENMPFILMTAYGTEKVAVDIIKAGARDYLKKPFSNQVLIKSVEDALKGDKSGGDNRHKQTGSLIGKSRIMEKLQSIIQKVQGTDISVLIQGESGTGKELVARAIHYGSPRANGAFVTVNCGAIPAELIESELFGHVEGAFTGAVGSRKGLFKLADGGSIFLDEVGDLPLGAQVKLLRVLEDGMIRGVGDDKPEKVDIRVIAATNADLPKAIEAKRFREDLYFRLNTIAIYTPPLRERKDDIRDLTRYFLDIYSAKHQRKVENFHDSALELLINYDWPGNVRELEKAVERGVVMAEKRLIMPQDLPSDIGMEKNSVEILGEEISLNGNFQEAKNRLLQHFEGLYFTRLLNRCKGNVSLAARKSGMHRKNIYEKLKELGIDLAKNRFEE